MNSDELIQIEEEAALWAARLRGGGMTDADREQLNAWLERNPEHQAVLARYRELSTALDQGFSGELNRPAGGGRRGWWIATTATALAAAAAVAIGLYVTRPSEYDTGVAERRMVALADGSRVELNARTVLSVALGRHERRVRLTQGEALFTVAHDAARPFFVETSAGEVRVTGTIFNVRTTADQRIEVTVIDGHVQLRPADQAAPGAVLDPDGQAIITTDHVSTRTLTDALTQDAVAWRTGQVVFENTPLAEALAHFSGYDRRQIDVAPAVADFRVGGRYSLDDLDGALASIEQVLPVRVVREAGVVRVVPGAASHGGK